MTDFYTELWEASRQVFDPNTVSRFEKFLYKITNPFRVTPICLTCGKEKGYWRDGNSICYKCELV